MKLDVLAIGAHPDDVELGCGGTLALLARAGRRVGILHLTRGERGTRGTPEERLAEAERAAAALGVADLAFLDTGDGGLRTGPAEEDALIEVLRTWRPELVLLGHGARAHEIAHGFVRGVGHPHRREIAAAVTPGQLYRIAAIGLDSVTGFHGHEGRRYHLASHPELRELPVERVPTRAGLITGAQLVRPPDAARW